MKKMVLVLLSFLLVSCSISANQSDQIEEHAVLQVAVPSRSYGDALIRLWDRSFSDQKGAIQIEVKKDSLQQQFASDIEWVSDCDAIYKKAYAQNYELENEYPIASHLQRKQLEGYFQPIEGKGLIYGYDASQLAGYGLQEDQMEDLATYRKPNMIFYDHSVDMVLSYWLASYEHERVTMDQVFLDESFLSCIANMKRFYKAHELEDDPYAQQDMFKEYLSGLVSSEKIISHPLYQSQELHFQAMPQGEDEWYAPIVDVYGFMVSKQCAYPQAAKAFLDLVRSKEGIQAFLDTTKGIVILKEEDLKDFSIYDALRKEMILAMNESVLWDISTIKDKPSVRYKDLYEKTDMVSILQNGIVADKTPKQIQKEIHVDVKEWIRKQ